MAVGTLIAQTGLRGTRTGTKIQDIVQLYDKRLFKNPEYKAFFDKLWEGGQRIYNYSFPEEERESDRTVMGYMKSCTAGEYGKDRFVYLVAYDTKLRYSSKKSSILEEEYQPGFSLYDEVDLRVRGMFSFDVLAPREEDAFGVIFASYLAVAKSARGRGIARKLVVEGTAVAGRHAEKNGYEIGWIFGEVERPERGNKQQIERVHVISSLLVEPVVPVVEKPDGSYEILYYAQPGLRKGAPPVPLMPVFSSVNIDLERGKTSFNTPIGILDTRIILDTRTVVGIINRVFGSYRKAPYADKGQINRIEQGVVESAGKADLEGFIRMETIGMAQDGVKK